MEVFVDTALLFKQIQEKVTRDGDVQGEVTEELFESELKVLRKRLRLKNPRDTPLEHEIRTRPKRPGPRESLPSREKKVRTQMSIHRA
ncbi:hypothetical protein BELL_0359g00110 [Botrytis elliptica]|uniref:Uncharacterized protein n=1 Tax=Botrytis elliptica TaxID=278938 RepID=A0A4Z1JIB8_9HELO|nr:hypothetical protein BELL_0359g00110 [Botrytis elliptica]